MATIFLTEFLFYRNGKPGVTQIVGNDTGTSEGRRVARYTFTAPENGANRESVTFHIAGLSGGSHIPIRFYIGDDPSSHANAGPDYKYTGEITISDDLLLATGDSDAILLPGKTYYLWVFPGIDAFGYYAWSRRNYVSSITATGAAISEVSGENGTLGKEHTITITRYADNFKNTVEAKCGTASLVIAENVNTDSVTWIPPIEWAKQNTTGLTVATEIKCTTYEGSKYIGSTTVSVEFFIPESVVPTVTAIVEDLNGYFPKYGNYIQSKSQAEVYVSGSGVYGSIITGYSISHGTVTQNVDRGVFDLPNTGDAKFTVMVTDSRGRTATTETTISVIAYFAPTVTILSAYRSDADGNQDDDGTYATILFKANITELNEKNSANYTAKYRVKGGTEWNEEEVENYSGEFAPDGAIKIVPVEVDFAYELCIVAKDDFSSVESIYRTVQVAFFLISTHKATKAVGIGQKATESGLCAFGIPAKFNAGVNVDGKTLVFAYNESIGGYVLIETEG